MSAVLDDTVWGFLAIQTACEQGDQSLEVLRARKFDGINHRNAAWVEEVLSANQTDLAEQTALELTHLSDEECRLIGMCSLAEFGQLDDVGPLIEMCKHPPKSDANSELLAIAIRGLGHTKRSDVIPVLNEVRARHHHYLVEENICSSLKEIGSTAAKQALKDCIGDPEFLQVDDAFRAFRREDRFEVIPLVLPRLFDTHNSATEDLLIALEEETGQRFGHNITAWQNWWDAQHDICKCTTEECID